MIEAFESMMSSVPQLQQLFQGQAPGQPAPASAPAASRAAGQAGQPTAAAQAAGDKPAGLQLLYVWATIFCGPTQDLTVGAQAGQEPVKAHSVLIDS